LNEIDYFFKKKGYKLERKRGYLSGLKDGCKNLILRIYATINKKHQILSTITASKVMIENLKDNYYDLYINLKKLAFQNPLK